MRSAKSPVTLDLMVSVVALRMLDAVEEFVISNQGESSLGMDVSHACAHARAKWDTFTPLQMRTILLRLIICVPEVRPVIGITELSPIFDEGSRRIAEQHNMGDIDDAEFVKRVRELFQMSV